MTDGFCCRDAAHLVRTITGAVKYLHDNGVVHRGMSGSRRLPHLPCTGTDPAGLSAYLPACLYLANA